MHLQNLLKGWLALSVLGAGMLLTACDEDTKKPENKKDDNKTEKIDNKALTAKVIDNTIDIVTVRAFADLTKEVTELDKACMKLQKEPTKANLDEARKLWKVARKTWEATEAFGFGPVGELEEDNKIGSGEDNYPLDIDPNMDTWPVDVSLMNQTIASNEPITKETIEKHNETRGFHLLEYVLWGPQAMPNTIETLKDNPRLLEYLVAGSNDMKSVCDKLTTKWPAFAKMIKAAGKGSKAYPTTKAAIEEMVTGMQDIADEVGKEKIEFPLNGGGPTGSIEGGETEKDGKPHLEKEESPFSNNSLQDFQDNLQSIYNLYTCSYKGQSGASISDLMVKIFKKPELDKKFKDQIVKAQNALKELPGTFTECITNHRDEVKKAQEEVIKVSEILENEIAPLVSNSSGEI